MGHRYTVEEVLDGAVRTAFDSGMSNLTFAGVAETLGSSDRMVVYYFPTKGALVSAVVVQLGAELQGLLEKSFGDEPSSVDDLLASAWPVLSTKRADRIFGLFFEMIGLASAGHEPYAGLVRDIMNAWVDWLSQRVIGSRADIRRQRALSVMARIDGLLLLKRTMGAEAASRAAREIIPGL